MNDDKDKDGDEILNDVAIELMKKIDPKLKFEIIDEDDGYED